MSERTIERKRGEAGGYEWKRKSGSWKDFTLIRQINVTKTFIIMLKESASRQERWIQAMTNRIIQSNLDTVYVNLYSWLGWFDDIEFITLLTIDTVEFETNLKISFLFSHYIGFESLYVEYFQVIVFVKTTAV